MYLDFFNYLQTIISLSLSEIPNIFFHYLEVTSIQEIKSALKALFNNLNVCQLCGIVVSLTDFTGYLNHPSYISVPQNFEL